MRISQSDGALAGFAAADQIQLQLLGQGGGERFGGEQGDRHQPHRAVGIGGVRLQRLRRHAAFVGAEGHHVLQVAARHPTGELVQRGPHRKARAQQLDRVEQRAGHGQARLGGGRHQRLQVRGDVRGQFGRLVAGQGGAAARCRRRDLRSPAPRAGRAAVSYPRARNPFGKDPTSLASAPRDALNRRARMRATCGLSPRRQRGLALQTHPGPDFFSTWTTSQRRVGVIGGVRIPFCRNNTSYAEVGNFGMSVKVLGVAGGAFGLHGVELGEVALGAVIRHSSEWNLAREVVLSSGLAPTTPGITTARACGTSLDNAIIIANKIAAGQIEAGIAGGSDTTSDVPIVYGERLRKRLLAMNRAKTPMDKLKTALRGFSFGELKPSFPGVAEPRTGMSMGQHCEKMAREWHISREAQDQLALDSHRKLAAAYEAGLFDDLVVPFRGLQARRLPAPGQHAGKAGHAQAGLRQELRPRHADRRQLHRPVRWRRRRAAGHRGLGGRARPEGAGLVPRRRGGRGGLRAWRRPADGARRWRCRACSTAMA